MRLSLLQKKKTIWLICSLPLIPLLALPFFFSPKETQFWGWCHAISGYTAVSLLVLTLSFAPLSKYFSSVKLFSILNRHKREVGLACFYYVLIHVLSYFVKKIIRSGAFPWKLLLHPVIVTGEIALLILLLLALTSNKWSMRTLKWHRWKTLHRFVYLAEASVFVHMALRGKVVLLWALALFVPLLIVQLLWMPRKMRKYF